MRLAETRNPGAWGAARGALEIDHADGLINARSTALVLGNQQARDRFLRDRRRERQVEHLHRCGPRPVFEALLAVAAGADLDDTLADLTRLPPALYRAVAADRLPDMPRVPLAVLPGGRA